MAPTQLAKPPVEALRVARGVGDCIFTVDYQEARVIIQLPDLGLDLSMPDQALLIRLGARGRLSVALVSATSAMAVALMTAAILDGLSTSELVAIQPDRARCHAADRPPLPPMPLIYGANPPPCQPSPAGSIL
jgi:hypothetical protein